MTFKKTSIKSALRDLFSIVSERLMWYATLHLDSNSMSATTFVFAEKRRVKVHTYQCRNQGFWRLLPREKITSSASVVVSPTEAFACIAIASMAAA